MHQKQMVNSGQSTQDKSGDGEQSWLIIESTYMEIRPIRPKVNTKVSNKQGLK